MAVNLNAAEWRWSGSHNSYIDYAVVEHLAWVAAAPCTRKTENSIRSRSAVAARRSGEKTSAGGCMESISLRSAGAAAEQRNCFSGGTLSVPTLP